LHFPERSFHYAPMARAKEFDEGEVLDRAIELFRKQGFQVTSFEHITRELGVSRQSLYDTFGDKQSLFCAALQRYRNRGIERLARALSQEGPLRPILLGVLESTVECSGECGCLLVNSMIEHAPRDGETRAHVAQNAHQVESLLTQRLIKAQQSGDVSKKKDPVVLARFLYHTMIGLSAAGRAKTEKAVLLQNARLALTVLD
jgi:TetR/AcrR family transcriptional regulator, transcriptional repressor for nem operon